MASRQLEVITGCMFSGKTDELIRRLERVRISGRLVLLFKPTIDDRSSERLIATHYGRKFDAYPIEPGQETVANLTAIVGEKLLSSTDVIAFDEGNFFSDKLPELCQELVSMGKRVIVAGLDLTYDEEPFGPMGSLMSLADRVDKLQAVCVKCGGVATRSQRIIPGTKRIITGGTDKYEARCRNCYERTGASP